MSQYVKLNFRSQLVFVDQLIISKARLLYINMTFHLHLHNYKSWIRLKDIARVDGRCKAGRGAGREGP